MDRTAAALVVLGILVVLVAFMGLGWRVRRSRQSTLPAPQQAPANLGTVFGTFAGLYVATTFAGQPVNRVAVRGLGFRAKTTVTVAAAGIVIPIKGQADILIPAATLREVTRASWVIDKGVEPNGLNVVGWTLGETTDERIAVDSYFRFDDPEDFAKAAQSVHPKDAIHPKNAIHPENGKSTK